MERGQREDSAGKVLLARLVCRRIMQVATAVIVVSFVAIIVATTFSTGPFVQVLGKVLYRVAVASAVVSLIAWLSRGWLDRRQG